MPRPRLNQDRIHEQNLRLLLTSPWLAELDDPSRDRVARMATRRIHRDSAALFRQGDECERVWLICSGSVQAMKSGPGGRRLVIHVAGPGETPGHTDLVDGGRHSVDAIALGNAETLSLPAAAMRAELLRNPAALMRLAVDLVGIVRTLDAAVADQALLSLDERLAKFLLSRRTGDDLVRLEADQATVASHLGVARQSLNRSLAALADQGLIAVEPGGREVRILDAEGLRSVTAGDSPSAVPRR